MKNNIFQIYLLPTRIVNRGVPILLLHSIYLVYVCAFFKYMKKI